MGIKRLLYKLFGWQYKREILWGLEKITEESLLKVLKEKDLIDFSSSVEIFV